MLLEGRRYVKHKVGGVKRGKPSRISGRKEDETNLGEPPYAGVFSHRFGGGSCSGCRKREKSHARDRTKEKLELGPDRLSTKQTRGRVFINLKAAYAQKQGGGRKNHSWEGELGDSSARGGLRGILVFGEYVTEGGEHL